MLAIILVITGGFFVSRENALAAAGINEQVNFQGKLVSAAVGAEGTNVPDGTYNMEFKIYQDGDGVPGGGDETLKWTEDRLRNNSQGVVVTDGIFQVNLGSVTALSGIDWNQSVLWVSINVGNTNASCTPFSSCSPDGEMNPMVRFTAAPYAVNALKVAGLTVTNTTGILTIPNAKTVQFADAFATSGAFATTLTVTNTTNATLPAGTVTLAALGTTQTWTAAQTFANATATDDTLGFSITTGGATRYAGLFTNMADLTGARTYSLQDNSGVVPLGTAGNNLILTTTGSTNVTLPTSGYIATNPMTTTGDIMYASNTATPATIARLAGAAGFLKSTGAAAPTWSSITNTDVGLGNVTNNAQLIAGNSTQNGYFGNLYLDDTNASNHLIIDYGSDVASDFTLSLLMTASRNLTIAGDASVSGTNTGDQFTNTTVSVLLGRGSAGGAGAAQEITLGTNLSMSGTTLNAASGGGGTLQNAYDASSGNTILTTTGRNITFTLGEVATPTSFTIENQDTAGTNAERVYNSIASGTLATGILIEQTGAGTMTDAIKILETAGAITTGINIGNNVTTGISIGTGVTTGISVGSGGITIASGALAVNSDSITSDGTLVINASGTVDIDDILNANSITSDAGVSIASGSSYTGAGAVTLTSANASGLTINSGTTGDLSIGTDASGENIYIGTGAAAKALTIGSTNTTSTTTIQSGSGGINLQANNSSTGNVQIGDGGTASATPDLLVLDIGSAEPTGAIGSMYYSTALNKFRCYQNSGWTDCIGSGSGSPGGSNTDIQFNDGGSFGGDEDFDWDKTNNTLALEGTDTEIDLKGITNEPSSPSADNLYLYSKSIGGRMMPKWKGPSGVDTAVQPFLGTNKVGWWNPPGNATTAPGVVGFTALSATGTATARNVATTNLFTRTRRLGYYYSTAGTNVVGGGRVGAAQYTVGDGSGLGGFYLISTFGQYDSITNGRTFVGMSSATGAPTTVEPSTLTNSIGVGCGTANTNLFIYYGGSSAQTPIDLGTNFPCNSTGSVDLYEFILFAPVNANNTVYYRVTRLGTSYQTSGTLTAATPGTQLPSSTTLLAWRGWRATAGTSGSPGIDIVNIYIESDY